uniref:HSF_DOMAIN domain-containing protein n=1 Tax=Anisakis simplex TaxID=6269 RepID=A0A0M3KG82_ANISI
LRTTDENNERSRTSFSESSVHSSDTSYDFSSFKPISELSEHSAVLMRDDDVEWLDAVQRYLSKEPVFQRKPIVLFTLNHESFYFLRKSKDENLPINFGLLQKPALKIYRRFKPQLSWHRCYHQWAIRQPPQPYRGSPNFQTITPIRKDVFNPFLQTEISRKRSGDVVNIGEDAEEFDYERGIFPIDSTNC